ncbi:MAG TPA: LysM peptidoglycan-binding domain-containing M23 family metallopeptidase [Stellaceae bacterium]|nr:LysM peptidoglycan-binding domain-containing M23 family metallopeptidase [Stellaceae bacterium]
MHLGLMLLTLALGACARTAPPAPVVDAAGRPTPTSQVPSQPRPPPPVLHPDSVTVQSGETLYGIARRYDVPVRSLIEDNRLTPPYRMEAGRKLLLPKVQQHIVQPGETLYSISRTNGVDTSTLARRNGLEPPYRIWVGEALILPAPVERAEVPVIQATAPAAPYAAPAESAPAPAVTAASEPLPPPPPPAPRPQSEAPVAAAPPPVWAPESAQGQQPAKREEKVAALPPPPAPIAPPPATKPAPAPQAKPAALPPPPPETVPGGSRTFLWPVHGRIIASYGNGPGGTHNDGINIAAPAGTPVLAADAGTVAYAGNELRGYGNLLLIKHANGWMTAYAHNQVLLVKRGDRVRRGQPIARVGATGAVGEPQLHFEIRHGTHALDPGDYLPPEDATASR